MRMTAKQYRKKHARRLSKYNNIKVEVDGYTFDSKAESIYYNHLKWLKKCGEINFFELQPKYTVHPGFEKNGRKFRPIIYIADFEIHHKNGSIETVDVKGIKTDVFKLKEKLFNKKFPHKLTLVKWERGRFVEV